MGAPANLKELNLFQKINHIMMNIDGVHKGANVSTGANGPSYKAVSHDDVTALLHKPCADMGIVIIPSITRAETTSFEKLDKYNVMKTTYRCDVWVDVMFINADKPDEKLVSSSYAYAIDSGDKATGKAYSMAVKYAYLKGFMLESYDDEESRDYENNNYASNGNNGNHASNKGNSNGKSNNNSGSENSKASDSKENSEKSSSEKSGQGASENQINAIKKICASKGLEVSEKFKNKNSCTSKEASEEIKRLSSVK